MHKLWQDFRRSKSKGRWFSSALSCLALLAVLSQAGCGSKPEEDPSTLHIVDESMVDAELLTPGPWAFAEHEYRTPAALDPEISPLLWTEGEPLKIEIRGRIFLPSGGGPRPLLIFLHGNYSTCGQIPTQPRNPIIPWGVDYTFSGSCPEGTTEILSYRGYDAAARHLASHGYAVASINANRGINGNGGRGGKDDYLVYARGLLVLKHIEALRNWSEGSPSYSFDFDLRDRINWSEIGLMGHSRGGEGVRFAHDILSGSGAAGSWRERLSGVQVQAIFEVGPIDRGIFTEELRIKRVAAPGVDWAVLIPGCDADVSEFEGVSPFRRMLQSDDGRAKAIFTLWGANHNFFNSAWQVSDVWENCKGSQQALWDHSLPSIEGGAARVGLTGSPLQQDALKALMLAFFRAHVGLPGERWPEGAHIFDPQYRLPSELQKIGKIHREFLRPSETVTIFEGKQAVQGSSASVLISDYLSYLQTQTAAMATAKLQQDTVGYKDIIPHFHEGAIVRPAWVFRPSDDIGPVNASVPFQAVPQLDDFWTLDLTLALATTCSRDDCKSAQDDLQVALVFADGRSSTPVKLRDYARLEALQGPLLAEGREWTDDTGDILNLEFVSQTALFQALRIEVKDFGALPSSVQVSGLRIIFPGAFQGELLLESVRLSKKPSTVRVQRP